MSRVGMDARATSISLPIADVHAAAAHIAAVACSHEHRTSLSAGSRCD